jgi:hypothetical protein
MSFKKPFRAPPVRLGAHYRRKADRETLRSSLILLLLAAIAGVILGVATLAITPDGRATLVSKIRPVAVKAGIARARPPQAGDYWRGCDDARSAGSAPIYSGEPGYREDMDGDGDGIACEAYR